MDYPPTHEEAITAYSGKYCEKCNINAVFVNRYEKYIIKVFLSGVVLFIHEDNIFGFEDIPTQLCCHIIRPKIMYKDEIYYAIRHNKIVQLQSNKLKFKYETVADCEEHFCLDIPEIGHCISINDKYLIYFNSSLKFPDDHDLTYFVNSVGRVYCFMIDGKIAVVDEYGNLVPFNIIPLNKEKSTASVKIYSINCITITHKYMASYSDIKCEITSGHNTKPATRCPIGGY